MNPKSPTSQHLRFTLTFLLFVLTDLVILFCTIPLLLLRLASAFIIAISAGMLLYRQYKLLEGAARTREEHARFLAAAESSMDDFYIFDGVYDEAGNIADFTFSYMNPNAERRLQIKRNSLIGKSLSQVRPFVVSSGLLEQYKQVVETGVSYTTEIFIDDEIIKATWIHVQAVKLGKGIAITSRNITESKRMADRVNYMAHHDHLTGLPNRALMQDRLTQAILRAQRNKKKVALFMLDVDHFKRINDTMGHAEGDALLAAMARRLLASVRESDTVARVGGDEFVVIMPDFNNLDEVKACGKQLVSSISRPLQFGDVELEITVSAGVCIYPDSTQVPEELLKFADHAMYVVKRGGRNSFYIYKPPARPASATSQQTGLN